MCRNKLQRIRQSCKILKSETVTVHANFKGLGCAVAFLFIYKIARLPKSSVYVQPSLVPRLSQNGPGDKANVQPIEAKPLVITVLIIVMYEVAEH